MNWLQSLAGHGSNKTEETAKSKLQRSGIVGEDELGELFEWGRQAATDISHFRDSLNETINERNCRVGELEGEKETLYQQITGLSDQLDSRNAELEQTTRRLEAKQAEMDHAVRKHYEQVDNLVLDHSRDLDILETRLNNEKRNLQAQLLVSGDKSQAWPDEKLRTQFRELCRIVDNATATIATTVDISSQVLGNRLDPDNSLSLVKGRPHFWLRWRVWSVLQAGFFSLPFGFGAFGPDRGAAEITALCCAWRSRLDGSTDSDLDIFNSNEVANRWRSITFQTLAAAATDGGSGSLIQLGHNNVTNVTDQIISLLSVIAGTQLQSGLQGEMRTAAGLAYELALQFGVNPARLVLLTAERSQMVVIGGSNGFIDCEDGEERRGQKVQVVMVASPGLQRIGDGRSETTQKHTVVPYTICTLRLSCNKVMLHNQRGDFKAKQPVRIESSRKSKDNPTKFKVDAVIGGPREEADSLLALSETSRSRDMKGLWYVPTRGIKPGIGVVVWLWLVTTLITIITICSIRSVPSSWRITRLLHAGMAFLSLYLLLHCLDLTVQQAGTAVTYNYIVFQSLNTVWRTFSDVFLLCGCWLNILRHQTPKVAVSRCDMIIAGTLWVLGLYKLGLQFALCFAWLDFVDIKKNRFHSSSSKICLFSLTDLDHQLTPVIQESHMAGWASYCLLVRAFCEVVIVGQLDRAPKALLKIYRAQDVCYSLFSLLFVIFTAGSIPSGSDNDPDPWELESKISARLAEEQRKLDEALQVTLQNSLDGWPEEADRLFKEKLAAVTESGTKSAPVVSIVLDTLRDQVRQEGSDERLRQGKLDHLERMGQDLEDWVPVYKWDGHSSDD
ncbi:uncharacterized protein NECHADRAFT_83216 [Fusarium vanettenii 77-13-4]|uniref:Uncharacterized protein n=1 Tax=Fusarium vanettenii (strain ATCC MYA-4622 / CBS 123669 / FGSC 9596 / NRRL 45880 / 77-13-4) TaxID=660122 RepID=C7ZB59_FUSV7|nr:uncharacterized protein NECHADRAFT_83216 [Fusarium vanettenii 77-13-4]EEU38878.1 predicted protein [Fusarium vanettenii 77-13-4]